MLYNEEKTLSEKVGEWILFLGFACLVILMILISIADKVEITNGFYMGMYPVTQKQWSDIMGTNPSHFKGCDDCPVENVSWYDVQEFIKKLNDVNQPMILQSGGLVFGTYRLPTEAEWEYAAKAGSTTDYYFGDDEDELGEYVWYEGNSEKKTHPVGLKKRNQFGLYDMLGNVWEWCEDWYDENYYKQFENSTAVDPKKDTNGIYRVQRGGYWGSDCIFLRSHNKAF